MKDGGTARIIGYKNETLGGTEGAVVDTRLADLNAAGPSLNAPELINIVAPGMAAGAISTALNIAAAKTELAKYPATPIFTTGGKARRGRTRRGGNRKSSKTKRRRH